MLQQCALRGWRLKCPHCLYLRDHAATRSPCRCSAQSRWRMSSSPTRWAGMEEVPRVRLSQTRKDIIDVSTAMGKTAGTITPSTHVKTRCIAQPLSWRVGKRAPSKRGPLHA